MAAKTDLVTVSEDGMIGTFVNPHGAVHQACTRVLLKMAGAGASCGRSFHSPSDQ